MSVITNKRSDPNDLVGDDLCRQTLTTNPLGFGSAGFSIGRHRPHRDRYISRSKLIRGARLKSFGRTVLKALSHEEPDFGVELPDDTEIRVWDSTAEMRYLVLPMRPLGTEGWSEEQLAPIVTRDSMIGTGLPQLSDGTVP